MGVQTHTRTYIHKSLKWLMACVSIQVVLFPQQRSPRPERPHARLPHVTLDVRADGQSREKAESDPRKVTEKVLPLRPLAQPEPTALERETRVIQRETHAIQHAIAKERDLLVKIPRDPHVRMRESVERS